MVNNQSVLTRRKFLLIIGGSLWGLADLAKSYSYSMSQVKNSESITKKGKFTMNLDNLVPYTHPSAAWSTHNSNIALFWSDENKSGLQCLETVIGWGGSPITDNLLSWQVEEDGNSVEMYFKSRNFRPDKIIEVSENANLKLSVIFAFPARNSVAVEFKLENKATTSRRLTVIFNFPGKGVAPDWQDSFPVENPKDIWATFLHRKPANHFVQIDDEVEGSWSTLFQHSEHGRISPGLNLL